MYRSKVKYVFKNGITQCERLTIATPGPVLHIRVRVIHYTVILLMVWKDYIQFLQWILYKIIELQVGKGILLIFEMCAVIVNAVDYLKNEPKISKDS